MLHLGIFKWKSGQVQTIVATKAFGMGIDKTVDMLSEVVSLKAFFLGHRNLAELAMMASRYVQQFCTEDQIFHIQMPGFSTICPIKRGPGVYYPILQNHGDLLVQIWQGCAEEDFFSRCLVRRALPPFPLKTAVMFISIKYTVTLISRRS